MRDNKRLGEVDVPYCETHIQEIQAFDAKGDKLVGKISIPLYTFSLIIILLMLFRPMYNWGIEAVVDELGGILGPIASGFSTIIFCAIIAGLLWFALFALLGKVFIIKESPPYGLEVTADTNGSNKIYFNFQNNTIAQAFLDLNKGIGAHEFVKQSFKEITGSLKKSIKEGMEESREDYRRKKR